MWAAAKAAGMSFSAYVRQRLGLDAPEVRRRDEHRSPPDCTCGIPVADSQKALSRAGLPLSVALMRARVSLKAGLSQCPKKPSS